MIGMPEMVAIGAVVVLLFGAKKIPEMGKSIGEGIREFKRSMEGITAAGSEETGRTPGDREKQAKTEEERV